MRLMAAWVTPSRRASSAWVSSAACRRAASPMALGAVGFGHLGADPGDAVGDVGPLGELADAIVAADELDFLSHENFPSGAATAGCLTYGHGRAAPTACSGLTGALATLSTHSRHNSALMAVVVYPVFPLGCRGDGVVDEDGGDGGGGGEGVGVEDPGAGRGAIEEQRQLVAELFGVGGAGFACGFGEPRGGRRRRPARSSPTPSAGTGCQGRRLAGATS